MINFLNLNKEPVHVTSEEREALRTLVQFLDFIERKGEAYHLAQKYDIDYEILEGPIALTPSIILAEFEGVDGTPIRTIEFENFWTMFPSAVDLITNQGYVLDHKFFSTLCGKHGKLMSYVCDNGREEIVFDPVFWSDREKEMVACYYLMKPGSQTKIPLDGLKRKLAEHDNREYRFPKVKKALEDKTLSFLTVFQQGMTDKYDDAMHSAGLTPSKEDFFSEVSSGKALLNDKSHLKNFAAWAKYFSHYGDFFTADEIAFKYGDEKSIIEIAANEKCLELIFDPSIWVDNLEEMERLWQKIPSDKQVGFDYLSAYTASEDVSYHIELPLDETLTKDMLFMPLNDKESGQAIIPLGLPWVWENFKAIQHILKTKGTPITLDDLQTTSGLAQESVLIKAARFGSLEHVMSLVDPVQGRFLSFEKCTEEAKTGSSMIKEVCAQYDLHVLFQPEKWMNNTNAMNQLWQAIPDGLAKQNVRDFPHLLALTNAMTVRYQAQQRPKQPEKHHEKQRVLKP